MKKSIIALNLVAATVICSCRSRVFSEPENLRNTLSAAAAAAGIALVVTVPNNTSDILAKYGKTFPTSPAARTELAKQFRVDMLRLDQKYQEQNQLTTSSILPANIDLSDLDSILTDGTKNNTLFARYLKKYINASGKEVLRLVDGEGQDVITPFDLSENLKKNGDGRFDFELVLMDGRKIKFETLLCYDSGNACLDEAALNSLATGVAYEAGTNVPSDTLKARVKAEESRMKKSAKKILIVRPKSSDGSVISELRFSSSALVNLLGNPGPETIKIAAISQAIAEQGRTDLSKKTLIGQLSEIGRVVLKLEAGKDLGLEQKELQTALGALIFIVAGMSSASFEARVSKMKAGWTQWEDDLRRKNGRKPTLQIFAELFLGPLDDKEREVWQQKREELKAEKRKQGEKKKQTKEQAEPTSSPEVASTKSDTKELAPGASPAINIARTKTVEEELADLKLSVETLKLARETELND